MLPVTYKEWQENNEVCHGWNKQGTVDRHLPFCISAEEAIRVSAQWLIERLYEPDVEVGACFRGRYLSRTGAPQIEEMAKEPVNWGDLHAMEVVRQRGEGDAEGVWLLTLEEAMEGQCPALCEYIRLWLARWGWRPMVVRTEW